MTDPCEDARPCRSNVDVERQPADVGSMSPAGARSHCVRRAALYGRILLVALGLQSFWSTAGFGQRLPWTLREEWAVEGATPDTPFGEVASVSLGEGGQVFVLDRPNSTVVVLDSLGSVLRTFGRRGEGPGEFSNQAQAVVALPEGQLVVADPGNRRATVFDIDGQVRDSWKLEILEEIPVQWSGE